MDDLDNLSEHLKFYNAMRQNVIRLDYIGSSRRKLQTRHLNLIQNLNLMIAELENILEKPE